MPGISQIITRRKAEYVRRWNAKNYNSDKHHELTIIPAGTKKANTFISIKYDGHVGG